MILCCGRGQRTFHHHHHQQPHRIVFCQCATFIKKFVSNATWMRTWYWNSTKFSFGFSVFLSLFFFGSVCIRYEKIHYIYNNENGFWEWKLWVKNIAWKALLLFALVFGWLEMRAENVLYEWCGWGFGTWCENIY